MPVALLQICGGYSLVSDELRSLFDECSRDGYDSGLNRRSGKPAGPPCPPLKDRRVVQFLFDRADVTFQTKLAIVGPYDEDNNELIDPLEIDHPPDAAMQAKLSALDPLVDVRYLKNIVAGSDHSLGSVRLLLDDGETTDLNISSAIYPFGHALCFRLMQGFVPRLTPNMFWATVFAVNGTKYTTLIDDVDYGDISDCLDQYIELWHGYNWVDRWEPVKRLPRRLSAALAKKQVEPADLQDYWLGRGKMYVFVRPDKCVLHLMELSSCSKSVC